MVKYWRCTRHTCEMLCISLFLKIVSDKLYLEPLMLTNGVEAASPILSLSESDLEYFLAMLTSLNSNFVDILMIVSE